MAMNPKDLLVWIKSLSRGQALPLDASEVHESFEDAQEYANTAIAYGGQTVKVKRDDGKYHEYILQPSEDGYRLEEIIGGGSAGIHVGDESSMPEGTVMHIDPEGEGYEMLELDTTLSKPGYAADAKETGDRLADLFDAVDDLETAKSVVNCTRAVQPMVTFVDDDGNADVWTKLKPLSEQYGIPYVSAMVTDRIGQDGSLTAEQLVNLQNMGWEIASHTMGHVHLGNLTDAEQEAQMRGSKEALEAIGIRCDSICYPFSSTNDSTWKIARKYYRCGRQTNWKEWLNESPLETWDLRCTPIGSYYETLTESGLDTSTLEYYKYQVDRAVSGNAWLIFMTHCNETDETQMGYLAQVIEYVQSLDIPIVTMREALDLRGNIVDNGRYDRRNLEDGHFVVGCDSTVEKSAPDKYAVNLPANFAVNGTPPSAFPWNTVSTCRVTGGTAGFPFQSVYSGGTLVTNTMGSANMSDIGYKDYTDGRTWQEFYIPKSSGVYRRYAIDADTWSEWSYGDDVVLVQDSRAIDDAVTKFPVGTKSKVWITKDGTTEKRPDGINGWLLTDRTDVNGRLFWQTFIPQTQDNPKGNVYFRRWTGTAWDAWTCLGERTGSTNMLNWSTTPKYVGACVFNTTLGKPVWWNGTAWVDATDNRTNISTAEELYIAIASGGAITLAPDADITVSQTLNLPAGTVILGNGATIRRAAGFEGIMFFLNAGCRLENFVIEGNRSAMVNPKWDKTIEISTRANCVIDGITINDANEAIVVYQDDVIVRGCKLYNCGGNGIHFSGANRTRVEDCVIIGANKNASVMGNSNGCIYWCMESNETVVTGCHCEDGIAAFGGVDGIDNCHLKIIGCTGKNCRKAVFGEYKSTGGPIDVVIADNQFIGCGDLELTDASQKVAPGNGLVISGNLFTDTSVRLQGFRNANVSGNTVRGGHVRLFRSPYCVIGDNVIDNPGDFGIYLSESSCANVSGNNVRCKSYGVYAEKSTGIMISGNIVRQSPHNVNANCFQLNDCPEAAIDNNKLFVYYGSGITAGSNCRTMGNFIVVADSSQIAIRVWGGNSGYIVAQNMSNGTYSIATGTDAAVQNNITMTSTAFVDVVYTLTNITTDGFAKALTEDNFEFTLTAVDGYSLPDAITVTMGGTVLAMGTGYAYDKASGKVTVYRVSGAVEVTAECA